MNCPKCDNNLWKASISYANMIVGKGFVAVNLNCSKCGYNAKAYIINKDLVAINLELKEIKEAIEKIEIKPIEKKPNFEKKKRQFNFWKKLFWMYKER